MIVLRIEMDPLLGKVVQSSGRKLKLLLWVSSWGAVFARKTTELQPEDLYSKGHGLLSYD